MARITELKRIQKHRTEEEMNKALNQFIDQKHMLHIPPDDEDADVVLSDAINELVDARKKIEELEHLMSSYYTLLHVVNDAHWTQHMTPMWNRQRVKMQAKAEEYG